MNDFFHIFGVAVFPIVCGFGLACLAHAIQRKTGMKKEKATNDFDKKISELNPFTDWRTRIAYIEGARKAKQLLKNERDGKEN